MCGHGDSLIYDADDYDGDDDDDDPVSMTQDACLDAADCQKTSVQKAACQACHPGSIKLTMLMGISMAQKRMRQSLWNLENSRHAD